jgi:hypothetical protein
MNDSAKPPAFQVVEYEITDSVGFQSTPASGLTQRRSGRRWPPLRPLGRARPVRRPVR